MVALERFIQRPANLNFHVFLCSSAVWMLALAHANFHRRIAEPAVSNLCKCKNFRACNRTVCSGLGASLGSDSVDLVVSQIAFLDLIPWKWLRIERSRDERWRDGRSVAFNSFARTKIRFSRNRVELDRRAMATRGSSIPDGSRPTDAFSPWKIVLGRR